jgi:hypothetical protein
MSATDALDPAIADLFDLDEQSDPADDMPDDAETCTNCTDNGCTSTCRGC